jgi:hypothetical protein
MSLPSPPPPPLSAAATTTTTTTTLEGDFALTLVFALVLKVRHAWAGIGHLG